MPRAGWREVRRQVAGGARAARTVLMAVEMETREETEVLAGDGGLRGLHVRRERLWPPCLAQNLATGKSEGRRGKASRQARWLRTAEGDPAYGEHEAADWRVREVGREGGLRLGIVQAAGAWRSGTRGGGRGSAEWGPLQPPAQEAEAVEGADILAELKAKGNPGSRRGRGSRAATGSDPKEMGHLTGSLYTPKP